MAESYEERRARILKEAEERERLDEERRARIIAEAEAREELEGIPDGIVSEHDDSFLNNTWEVVGSAGEQAAEQVVRTLGDLTAFANDVGPQIVVGSDEFVDPLGNSEGIPIPFTDKRIDFVSNATFKQLEANYTAQTGEESKTLSDFELPDVDRPDSTAGQITSGIIQFGLVFAATRKATGLRGYGGTIANSAIADAAAFDPHAGRFSDLLTEIGEGNPAFDNAVTQYLSSDVDDSNLEGRLKNSIEGMFLGTVADVLFAGIKSARNSIKVRRARNAADAQRKFDEQVEVEMDEAARAPDDAEAFGFFDESTEQLNREALDASSSAADSPFHVLTFDDGGMAVVSKNDSFKGGMNVEDRGEFLQSVGVGVGDAEKGFGSTILKEGIDYAFSLGKTFASDSKLSPSAARMWDKLEAAGYKISKQDHIIDEAGDQVSKNGQPLYRVVEAPEGVGSGRVNSKIVKLGKETDPATFAREIDSALRDSDKVIDIDVADIADPQSFKVFMERFEEAVAASLRSLDTVANKETVARAEAALADKFGPNAAEQLTRSLAGDETGNLAARIVASDLLSASTNKKLLAIVDKARRGSATENMKIAAFRLYKMAYALDSHARGSRAEVGRALQAMSTTKAAREGVEIDFKEMLRSGDFYGDFDKLMAAIHKNRMNPKAVAKLVRPSKWSRIRDVLQEVFYNNLLSAPSTSLINITGNALKLVEHVFVRGSVLGAKGLKAVISGSGLSAAAKGELAGYVQGLKRYRQDAFRLGLKSILGNAEGSGFKMLRASREERAAFFQEQDELGNVWKALLTGRGQVDNITKIGEGGIPRPHAVQYTLPADFDDLGKFQQTLHQGLRALAGTAGGAIRLPSKAILGIDEAFKTLANNLEVNSQAYADAYRMVDVTGGKRSADDVAQELLSSGSYDKAGVEFARDITFQKKLGKLGAAFEEFLHKFPTLRFAIPFVRTPANLVKDAISWVPGANLMTKRFWDQIAEGGVVRERAVAKFAMSTGLAFYIHDLWDSGRLKGRRDGTDSEQLRGVREYSIKVGDEWHQFNRFDPLGMSLGFLTDFYDLAAQGFDPAAEKDASDLVYGFIAATMENFTSKMYLRQVSDLIGFLEDARQGNEAQMEEFGASLLVNLIPFAGSNFERRRAAGQDEFSRYAFSEMDKLRARVPESGGLLGFAIGDRGDLGVRRDVLGRPIKERLGMFTLSAESEESRRKVDLRLAEMKVNLPDAPRSLSGVQLDSKQYSKLQYLRGQQVRVLGKTLEEAILDEMDSPLFQLAPSYRQDRMIINLFNDYGDEAEDVLLGQDKELAAQVAEAEKAKFAERAFPTSGDPFPGLSEAREDLGVTSQ